MTTKKGSNRVSKIVLFIFLLFLGAGLVFLSTVAESLNGYCGCVLAIAIIVGVFLLCGTGMTAGGQEEENEQH